MLKKYCDIIGVNIPEKECKELQTENLDDCKGCESVLEDVKKITPKPLKVKSMGEKNIIGQKEPVCGGCGKKPSEVAKFNLRTNTCNACYQKEYRLKQGPRIRKIKEEGDPPPPEVMPCCSECGVKCTEAETFDIKERLCGKCAPDIKEPVQVKAWEVTGTKRPGDELRVPLDFTEFPEMYEELMALAKNEMRTPETQILYLLKYGNFDALKH